MLVEAFGGSETLGELLVCHVGLPGSVEPGDSAEVGGAILAQAAGLVEVASQDHEHDLAIGPAFEDFLEQRDVDHVLEARDRSHVTGDRLGYERMIEVGLGQHLTGALVVADVGDLLHSSLLVVVELLPALEGDVRSLVTHGHLHLVGLADVVQEDEADEVVAVEHGGFIDDEGGDVLRQLTNSLAVQEGVGDLEHQGDVLGESGTLFVIGPDLGHIEAAEHSVVQTAWDELDDQYADGIGQGHVFASSGRSWASPDVSHEEQHDSAWREELTSPALKAVPARQVK